MSILYFRAAECFFFLQKRFLKNFFFKWQSDPILVIIFNEFRIRYFLTLNNVTLTPK